jgi:hypothetical protein
MEVPLNHWNIIICYMESDDGKWQLPVLEALKKFSCQILISTVKKVVKIKQYPLE